MREGGQKEVSGRGDQNWVDMLILSFRSCIQVFREACGDWMYEPDIQKTGLSWKSTFEI